MYDRLGRKIRTVSETAAYINVPSQKAESLHNRFLDLFENDMFSVDLKSFNRVAFSVYLC